MIISWLGQTGLKIEAGDALVFVEPPLEAIKRTAPRLLLSTNGELSDIKKKLDLKETTVINSPGEYEVSGVFVYAFPAAQAVNGHCHYVMELENMLVGYIASVARKDITDNELKELEDVDILCLPIGGNGSLSVKEAAGLASELEPRLVIPFGFDKAGVESFLKELGQKGVVAESKLKIQKKDLPQEDMKVVVLEPTV
ncbi:MAG: MBL fold metallo-hydrolase [bacterium]